MKFSRLIFYRTISYISLKQLNAQKKKKEKNYINFKILVDQRDEE
jgi:hypothetical protein